MGMHEVSIDDDAALAAIDEIAGGGPGPAVAGGGHLVLQEPTPSEWKQMAKMAAQLLANAVTPNWKVPQDVQDQWADALADCLDQLFPGGLANIANWGPWAKLAYASVMWGLCGVDFATGTLLPPREPKKPGNGEQGPVVPEVSPAAAAAAGGRHMMG